MAWNEFDDLRLKTVFALSELARYCGTMEQQITLHKAEKLTEVRSLIEQHRVPEDLLQSYDLEFEQTIVKSFRYSYVVLLFLALQSKLEIICDYVQARRNVPLRARDLRGDGIDRCTVFLKKMANIPLDNIPYWSEISDLSKVRNCIVHAEGCLDRSRDRDRLRELCKRDNGLASTGEPPEDVLVVGPQYCATTTDHMFDAFNQILTEILYADSRNQ